MKLELFVMTGCPFCGKVLNFLKSTGRTDVQILNITADPAANERLLREGGMDQVPCLFIDGKPLYESGDIIEWLGSHPAEKTMKTGWKFRADDVFK